MPGGVEGNSQLERIAEPQHARPSSGRALVDS
jgi:hypothetical protein